MVGAVRAALHIAGCWVATSCTIGDLNLNAPRQCPCVEGYVCDKAHNTCVLPQIDASVADLGEDGTAVAADGQNDVLSADHGSRPDTVDAADSGEPIVPCAGTTIHVSPDGDDGNEGTETNPLASIVVGLQRASPGDCIQLEPGIYLQDIASMGSGQPRAPILVKGPKQAVVKGAGSTFIVSIRHSHIWFEGFTLDGRFDDTVDVAQSYRKKLILAEGVADKVAVEGLVIRNMTLRNALDECVRLRYFTRGADVVGNTISNCGLEDFRFGGSGTNGEGIYLGTSPAQLPGNPTSDPDETEGNRIRNNDVSQVGECVDIKDAADNNVLEGNRCDVALAGNTGGINIRSNGNVLRNNTVSNSTGAGIRLGGGQGNGIDNALYGNIVADNLGFGMKVQAAPQGSSCGNQLSNNREGDYGGDFASALAGTASVPCS